MPFMVTDLRLSPWVLKYKLSYFIEDQINSSNWSTIVVRMCLERLGPILLQSLLLGAMRQRILGSPPCHRRMVITT